MTEAAVAVAGAGADWAEAPAARSRSDPGAAPRLRVEGFEGPLDFLLEMVRRQRLDLGRLSIVAIVDQFVAALEAATARVPLERQGDWVVMASTLVLLKAQMLAPGSPEEAAQAEAEARRRFGHWEELARMRAAAAWLSARLQLGRDVFGRGAPEIRPQPRSELYVAFLEATLVLLEGRDGQGGEEPSPYQPVPLDLWRVPEAMARLQRLLAEAGAGGPLERFLPEIPAASPRARLRRRAALASTLVAALELARDGVVELEQEASFGPIWVRPGARRTAELGAAA